MENTQASIPAQNAAAGTQVAEPDEGASATIGVPRLDQPGTQAAAGNKEVTQGVAKAANPGNPTLEEGPPGAAWGEGELKESLQANITRKKNPVHSMDKAEQGPPQAGGPPKESGTISGGWGWLPSTAALQQAAAGALRDVRELTDSFQQACVHSAPC